MAQPAFSEVLGDSGITFSKRTMSASRPTCGRCSTHRIGWLRLSRTRRSAQPM